MSRCEGRDHWFHRSSVPDGRNYTACFKDLLKKVIRVISGANTGAVQSYLTFSVKLLTFFWLDISLYNVAQKCKTCSRLPKLQKALLLTPEVLLILSRFSSPDLSGLKCSAFLRPIPKRDDISHYELALFSFSTSFF